MELAGERAEKASGTASGFNALWTQMLYRDTKYCKKVGWRHHHYARTSPNFDF